MELHTITEPSALGKPERITPLGFKTTIRAVPCILAALDDADPCNIAAMMKADAVGKIGSIKVGDLAGSTDNTGGVSDDEATTRVKYATRLRATEAMQMGGACIASGA